MFDNTFLSPAGRLLLSNPLTPHASFSGAQRMSAKLLQQVSCIYDVCATYSYSEQQIRIFISFLHSCN